LDRRPESGAVARAVAAWSCPPNFSKETPDAPTHAKSLQYLLAKSRFGKFEAGGASPLHFAQQGF